MQYNVNILKNNLQKFSARGDFSLYFIRLKAKFIKKSYNYLNYKFSFDLIDFFDHLS